MDRNDYYGGESTSLNLIQVLISFTMKEMSVATLNIPKHIDIVQVKIIIHPSYILCFDEHSLNHSAVEEV